VKRIFLTFILFLAYNANAFTVAIVPQFTPTITERSWSPIIKEIEKISKTTLTLKYYKNITEFEKGLSRGEVDFAYMNPYHIVMFNKNYKPLVRDDKQKLSGILVVRSDSRYKSVKDLNGEKIAFPSPNAFASSLLIRSQLQFVEKIEFEPVYVNTHTNVFKYVVMGDSEAGAGVNKTLKKESSEVQSKLRILYTTPEANPHPFCANKRVPANIAKKIQDAFLSLATANTEMSKALEGVEISKPVKADYKMDYSYLEKSNLSKLVVAE